VDKKSFNKLRWDYYGADDDTISVVGKLLLGLGETLSVSRTAVDWGRC